MLHVDDATESVFRFGVWCHNAATQTASKWEMVPQQRQQSLSDASGVLGALVSLAVLVCAPFCLQNEFPCRKQERWTFSISVAVGVLRCAQANTSWWFIHISGQTFRNIRTRTFRVFCAVPRESFAFSPTVSPINNNYYNYNYRRHTDNDLWPVSSLRNSCLPRTRRFSWCRCALADFGEIVRRAHRTVILIVFICCSTKFTLRQKCVISASVNFLLFSPPLAAVVPENRIDKIFRL